MALSWAYFIWETIPKSEALVVFSEIKLSNVSYKLFISFLAC